MKDKDKEKAYKLVNKQKELAQIFEMGKYHEESLRLDWGTTEKKVDETIEIMEKMLASVSTISVFTKSTLYEHMEFKKLDEKFIKELHENLLTNFSDEETFSYMKESKYWRELINGNFNLSL